MAFVADGAQREHARSELEGSRHRARAGQSVELGYELRQRVRLPRTGVRRVERGAVGRVRCAGVGRAGGAVVGTGRDGDR